MKTCAIDFDVLIVLDAQGGWTGHLQGATQ